MANRERNRFTLEFLSQWISGAKTFEIETSGTTGLPKKVSLKRKWMEISALQTIGLLGLWNERVYCCLPTFKVGGLMMLVRALAGGFDLRIEEPVADPMACLDTQHTFTFVSLVPYQLNRILENRESTAKLNRFKNILLGGSEVSESLCKKLEGLQPDIFHTYGLTETCSHIALKKLNHGPWPYFKPNPGVKIHTDANGAAVITALQTGEQPVSTGDILEIYPDGGFVFKGRADIRINTGGMKVHPELLEPIIARVFEHHGWDNQAAVTSVSDSDWGEAVVLVLAGNSFPGDEEVYNALSGSVSKFEMPKIIVHCKQIPVNTSGKTDRLKLRSLAEEI